MIRRKRNPLLKKKRRRRKIIFCFVVSAHFKIKDTASRTGKKREVI
jgi:hypothetical protein